MDFEDPRLGVKSDDGAYDALGGADFDQANFRIFDRNGRGFAKEMAVHPGRQGAICDRCATPPAPSATRIG